MANEILISAENISRQIGSRTIISPVTFGLHQGDRVGLIGVNGSGKSTILKLIAAVDEPSSGEIVIRKGIRIDYLPQDPVFDADHTALEHIIPSYEQLTDNDIHRYKAILTKLGLNEFDRPLSIMSGGQRRKADLARVMVNEPDVLLLDEPTNHLDLDTIEWLQGYLANENITLILVTHDRYFLDAVCNKMIEIDRSDLYFYQGNYSDFIKAKLLREVDNRRKETRRQAQLKKELDWLNRGAKARSSKPKHHIDRVRELLSKSYLIDEQDLDISFITHRLGKTILQLHKISKSYDGRALFQNVDHNFLPRERVGIIGTNGCGKTTFLRIITGEEEADSGIIKTGMNTRFAYYRQEDIEVDGNITVYEYIANTAEIVKTKDGTKLTATEMLKRFLFDNKMQQMRLSSLSGGERKRLYLLRSLLFGANFIILDEPTNDLDIKTLEILEDYLDAFDGCLLIVSHDRFFLDRTIDYLFIFEGNTIRKFTGNYSDYLLVKRYYDEEKGASPPSPITVMHPAKINKGLSYNEKRELDILEREIERIEQQVLKIEDNLNLPGLAYTTYAELSKQLEELNIAHSIAFERWSVLIEKK